MSGSNSNDESLIAVADVVHPNYQRLFSFPKFNQVQSAVVRQVLDSNANMVIAAPTGSGKTALHELAIVRLLVVNGGNNIKAVFIAPSKALCQQRRVEWERSFGSLGLQ